MTGPDTKMNGSEQFLHVDIVSRDVTFLGRVCLFLGVSIIPLFVHDKDAWDAGLFSLAHLYWIDGTRMVCSQKTLKIFT